MKRLRRCKIVATLGPASDTREVLAKLFVAGVDVFRINMSHASHDGMRERIRMIRSLEEEYSRPIGILVGSEFGRCFFSRLALSFGICLERRFYYEI